VHAVGGTGRSSGIWYFTNSASGTVSVTIDQSATFSGYSYYWLEIGPSTFDVSGSDIDTANVTSHHCAASGSLDTAADVIVISGGILNSTPGTATEATGYTLLEKTGNLLRQYISSSTALTDERGTWTTTTARSHICCSASFKSPASSASSLPIFMHHYSQQGVI
jgi:hypothetical protein